MLDRLIQLWRRLLFYFRGERFDRELEDEMRFHLQMKEEENLSRGMGPEEARLAARRQFGNVTLAKEGSRDLWAFRYLETLWQDLRYGVRVLLKNPGFTAISVFTLALGIGASTAIFSAVNPILFEPLPYPKAGRLTMIWDSGQDGSRNDVTFGTYSELVERSHSFDVIAVMKPWQPTLIGPAEPERLDGQRVSAGYFSVLGVPPALGRDFDSSDDRLNGPRVAILSDGLWRRRFSGDPTIIGRQITLDDDSYTVIGVMPSAFENLLAPSAELWSPLQYDMSQGSAWGHHLRMVGRLRPGVGLDQARGEMDVIAHAPAPEYPRRPWASLKNGFIANSLQDEVTRGVKPALLAVLGAVLLVLTIACVNVTNLLLTHGAQRRGEFAVRAALGAARMRLIRQLLTESLLLACLGGSVGLLLAVWGVELLISLAPPNLPRAGAIRVDATVFLFAVSITTLIGLVVGLIPALQTSRADLHIRLKQSSGQAAGARHGTRRALVVAEIALALVLLVSAGLLLRSLHRLFAISPGFNASDLLAMQVQTSGRRFDDETTHRFFAQALEAVRQTPRVTAAAFTSQLPLSGDLDEYGVQFEPRPDGKVEWGYPAFRYAVSPGYFETMGIPLRSGRLLDERDSAVAPGAVLISESLAKRRFPDQDPIGKRLHVGRTDLPWYTIVGVVGDVKQASLAAPQTDAVFIAPEQWYFADSAMWLVVRARGDVAELAPALRKAIWSVDKDQPIVRVATMDDLLAATAGERRFALILFETFGLVALVLAAIGIYGVLSGTVTERTREIGLRLALGAQRRDVLGLILRQGVKLTLSGVAIGLLAAWAVTRVLTKLLYAVGATDPLTFVGLSLLLIVVALVACWIPARRATKVDPMVALKYE